MHTPTRTPWTATLWKGVSICAIVGLTGCASPLHLTYDFGRAFTEAFTSQANLTRPSVANSTYHLYGMEAAEIRIRVREETTAKPSGASQLSN